MGNVNVEAIVTKYLVARVGQTVIINEITEGTGLRPEQIRAVIRRQIAKNKMHLQVVSRGHVWHVASAGPNPNPAVEEAPEPMKEPEPEPDHQPTRELFTQDERSQLQEAHQGWELHKPLGRDRDGLLIIQMTDGELYRATPL